MQIIVSVASLLWLSGRCAGFTRHLVGNVRGIGPNFGPILKSSVEDETVVDADSNDDENKNKIFLWLSKGRRVEAFREEQSDEGEDDDRRSRALTSGAARFEGRYSASDWLHNFSTLPNSSILNEIRNPIILTTVWATFVSIVHFLLNSRHAKLAHHMTISDKPHSLMVSALSLLLVFRTNSAYQRFAEGRKIWERILTHSRDLSRMMLLYEAEVGKEKRRRVQRLLAAFPYLLRHRIRPNLRMNRLSDTSIPRDPENSVLLYDDSALFDDDAHAASVASDEEEKGRSRRKTRELFWVDKRALPWRLLPGSALAACARAQNRPLWVCDRMAAELVRVPDQEGFTNRERLMLLNIVHQISHTIGECERIHQTVVPLNYARHCLRGVTIWLLTLPFALVSSLGLLTGPCLTVMSWLLYGIYQIGYNIEDPFQSTLRLSILCDAIRRDVFAEELLQRDTAFVLDREEGDGDDLDSINTTSSAITTTSVIASESIERENSTDDDNSEEILERESDYYLDDIDELPIISLEANSSVDASTAHKPVSITPVSEVLADEDYEDSDIVTTAIAANIDAAMHVEDLHLTDNNTTFVPYSDENNSKVSNNVSESHVSQEVASLVSTIPQTNEHHGSSTTHSGSNNNTHSLISIRDETNAFE